MVDAVVVAIAVADGATCGAPNSRRRVGLGDGGGASDDEAKVSPSASSWDARPGTCAGPVASWGVPIGPGVKGVCECAPACACARGCGCVCL